MKQTTPEADWGKPLESWLDRQHNANGTTLSLMLGAHVVIARL